MLQNKNLAIVFYFLYLMFIVCCTQTGFASTNFKERISTADVHHSICSQGTDSLHLKIYLADREYFLKLQETVSSKNQYIGLQWCIDLLSKYIEIEERKFKEMNK